MPLAFVPYANKDFKKAMVDQQLSWLWEHGIKPQIAAIMENLATGDKVLAGNWKEDRIVLKVGIDDVKHYVADDFAISFECSMQGRPTNVVIPYSCIASVQSSEESWLQTRTDKIDPYWMAFPMALVDDLKEISPTIVSEAKITAKAKVEIPVAVVKSVEGNVVHVQFGKKK